MCIFYSIQRLDVLATCKNSLIRSDFRELTFSVIFLTLIRNMRLFCCVARKILINRLNYEIYAYNSELKFKNKGCHSLKKKVSIWLRYILFSEQIYGMSADVPTF